MFINKTNFYQNPQKIFISFFLILFAAQFIFWIKTEHIKPNVHVVPPVPNKHAVEALSLGDKEFYFRVLALKIQNAGDSFGRFTALKLYDFNELYKWFKMLDTLNDQSAMIPSLASYYYSQTQTKADTIHLVKYLDEYASKDVDKYWWWFYQAIHISLMSLHNDELALELANKVSKNKNPNSPLWIRRLPAILYAKLGQDCTSFGIIQEILKENETGSRKLSADDIEFIKFFIERRIKELKGSEFDPRKCVQKPQKHQ